MREREPLNRELSLLGAKSKSLIRPPALRSESPLGVSTLPLFSANPNKRTGGKRTKLTGSACSLTTGLSAWVPQDLGPIVADGHTVILHTRTLTDRQRHQRSWTNSFHPNNENTRTSVTVLVGGKRRKGVYGRGQTRGTEGWGTASRPRLPSPVANATSPAAQSSVEDCDLGPTVRKCWKRVSLQKSLLSQHRGGCVYERETHRQTERQTLVYSKDQRHLFLQRYFISVNKILFLSKAHKNSHYFKLEL